MLRSVLVATDFSPTSERAAARATLLSVADAAQILLLHVVPKRLPQKVARRCANDAGRMLARMAATLSRKFAGRVVVRSVVKRGAAATEIARHARAVKAELIVMGRGRRRPLRDAVLGSTAERVIRRGQLPVLAVRLAARARYRRPLFALDFDDAASDAVASMSRVIPSPRPEISLLHVYEVPFGGATYSGFSAEDTRGWSHDHRRMAIERIESFLSGLKNEELRWNSHVTEGSPRMVIEATALKIKADLLVLGTHGYSGVAHAFLGTVAGDVLRRVPCDVLAVPPRSHSTAESA